MTKETAIKLFNDKRIRVYWDKEAEKWYFCLIDIIEVLKDSANPRDYIKKLRKHDPDLSIKWGQIVKLLPMQTAGGMQHINCADVEGVYRFIQSIPLLNAELFKIWLAKVGY